MKKSKKLLVLLGIMVVGVILTIVIIKNISAKKETLIVPEVVGDNVLFKDGLCMVREGKWGYIDKTGEYVIEPQYTYAEQFSEGLARVGINEERFYINKQNENLLDVTSKKTGSTAYTYGRDFGEGLIVTRIIKLTDNGNPSKTKSGFLDIRTKELVIDYKFNDAGKFVDGVAQYFEVGSGYGYIDKTGKVIVPAIYDYPYDFNGGYGLIQKDEKLGLVDTQGNIILEPEYDYIDPYMYRNRRIVDKDGKRLIVDNNGKVIEYSDEFTDVYPFSETDDLALVKKDGKYGYINTEGKCVIEPIYEKAETFMSGHAIVTLGDKYMVINTNNEVVYESKTYVLMNLTKSGIMKYKYKTEECWIGYMKADGTKISGVEFCDKSTDFYDDGYAIVKKDGKEGIINRDNQYVVKLSNVKIL